MFQELIQEHRHRVPEEGSDAAITDVYDKFGAVAKKQIVKCIDTARRTGRDDFIVKTKLLPRGAGEAFVSAEVVETNAQVRLLPKPFLSD